MLMLRHTISKHAPETVVECGTARGPTVRCVGFFLGVIKSSFMWEEPARFHIRRTQAWNRSLMHCWEEVNSQKIKRGRVSTISSDCIHCRYKQMEWNQEETTSEGKSWPLVTSIMLIKQWFTRSTTAMNSDPSTFWLSPPWSGRETELGAVRKREFIHNYCFWIYF